MLIILTGKKRTGKTTASDFFIQNGFKSFALADEFKIDLTYVINRYNILGKHFDYKDANGQTEFDREEKIFDKKTAIRIVQFAYYRILGDDQKYNYVDDEIENFFENDLRDKYSFREIMQITGTDIGCNIIDKNIWVKRVINKIIDSDSKDFIISDCRQQHEIDSFRKFSPKVIHIKRDLINNDDHVTEKSLLIEDNDIVIDNNKSLKDFEKSLKITLNLIKNIQ